MATTVDFLASLSEQELTATAEKLGVKTTGVKPQQLIPKIQRAAIRANILAEAEVRAELKIESLDRLGADGKRKKRPSPQDIAIEVSPKVVVHFLNLENPATSEGDGADVPFTVGTHVFHLYDDQKYVMPECLVCSNPLDNQKVVDTLVKFWVHAGLNDKRARVQAVNDLINMNLTRRCVYPQYKNVEDPATGHVTSHRVKDKPRFMFTIQGPADPEAKLGMIVEPTVEEGMSDEEMIESALAQENENGQTKTKARQTATV